MNSHLLSRGMSEALTWEHWTQNEENDHEAQNTECDKQEEEEHK